MPLQEGANNGTWILLKIGGKVLGGQTNLNFESTADTIDTTTKLSKDARKTVLDRKSTRLNSSHSAKSRMPSSA